VPTTGRTSSRFAEVESQVEVTILMPCLNEGKTLPSCIAKSKNFLIRSGCAGEVLIADNGSVDGSQEVARSLGCRVISVEQRGYGAALRAGIMAAHGQYIVMGDADDSYDFSKIDQFVEQLRKGNELVIGNRFRGGIERGAMPLLHRWLGNPVLSFLGRLFFGSNLGDFHCGLRGFSRQAMLQLQLRTTGMEFASEMIVKALQAGLRTVEVPTTLAKDGRGRPPHLNTWRDGWRHLRFLLLFAPRWLFLYPGLTLLALGCAQLAYSHSAGLSISFWPVGIHTQLFAMAVAVLGWQTLLFASGAVLARDLAGLDSPHPRERLALRLARSLWLSVGGVAALAAGFALCAALALEWSASSFGPLNPEVAMRKVILGVGLALGGSQALLASMYFAALRAAFDSSRVLVHP